MLTIFKKEFLSYFRSAKGYAFIAVNILFTGVFISLCNFLYQSSRIERSLEMMVFVLLFTIPVITMKSFAAERANGTDRLILTLPLRSREIVIGKLLAALSLIGIAFAIILVFPLILSAFGTVNFAASYAAILGYALFAVAFTAICIFISCTSKKVLTAGLISYGVSTVLFALWLVLLNYSAKLPKIISSILAKLSFIDVFDGFALGMIEIYNIIFYVSIAAFFIFLTFFFYNNRQKELKPSPVIALVLAVVLVAINALSAIAPKRFGLDLSQNKTYSISESTVKFLSSLDEDVTVYVIDSDGTSRPIEHQLALFDEHSDSLSVKYVTASELADELTTYGYTEKMTISPYSIYVKSEHRSAFADAMNMYVYYHPSFGEMSYSTYNSYLYTLSQYAQQDASYYEMFTSLVNDSIVYYQLDAMLANYIEYVSVDVIPTLYYMTNHGTLDMSSILGLTLNDMGIKTIDISSVNELPADVGTLIINAPDEDLTATEAAMLRSYLDNGGAAVFLTNSENLSMPNLMSLLTAYGVSADAGLVAVDKEAEVDATDEDSIGSEPIKVPSYNIYASANADHDVLHALDGEVIPFVNANHITVPSETDGSLIITPILTTAADAYIDGVENSEGTKTLGIAIEKETENGTTEIVWLTGADSFLDDNISVTAFYSVVYSATWGIESYESKVSDIPPTLMSENMIITPESTPKVVAALSILLTITISVCGLVVCHKRKSRKPVVEEVVEE